MKHVEYYSETRDDSVPTIDLGVANTERGTVYDAVLFEFQVFLFTFDPAVGDVSI